MKKYSEVKAPQSVWRCKLQRPETDLCDFQGNDDYIWDESVLTSLNSKAKNKSTQWNYTHPALMYEHLYTSWIKEAAVVKYNLW